MWGGACCAMTERPKGKLIPYQPPAALVQGRWRRCRRRSACAGGSACRERRRSGPTWSRSPPCTLRNTPCRRARASICY